jgi:hypothetical protein
MGGGALFAINHAATALLIKRRFRKVPMVWLLVSVQLIEIVWVAVSVAALASPAARDWVDDAHLPNIPYAHSIVSSAAIALFAWLALAKLLRRYALGAAVAVGIVSHVALDLLAQLPGAAFAPSAESAAFALQAAYGVLCWRVFRGTKPLLAVILALNLAGLFLAPHLDGPEGLLVRPPLWLVGAVAAEIVLSVALVWRYSGERAAELEGWLGR